MTERLLRKLLPGVLAALAVVAVDAAAASVHAGAAAANVINVYPGTAAQAVKIGVNKSLVIDLPRDARDVLVSNPNVVDAVIRTPRRLYLTAIPSDAAAAAAPTPGAGETNVIVFDRAGVPIVNLDVSVEQQDTNRIKEVLARLIPGSAIEVEWAAGNIVMSGTVKSDIDARKAVDIATAFLGVLPPAGSQTLNTVGSATAGAIAAGAGAGSSAGGGAGGNSQTQTTVSTAGIPKVVNLLTILGEDQVQIKVTVAEVQRNVVKELGVDLNGVFTIGNLTADLTTVNPFPLSPTQGPPSSAIVGAGGSSNNLFGTLKALEETGMVRTLAEPTLTAISGESASFLAGGEFPIPAGSSCSGPTGAQVCTVNIEFKPFGVSLTFTPVVLTEGRISLHVKTEVSDLTNQNEISLLGTTVPAIEVRRSESTLELPSGGAMVMGGLLQDNIRQTINAIPGLERLPILGTLFRSRDFKRNETELVIMVTPYIVRPVPRTALARPDDGLNPASDSMTNLLGRMNRVYGVEGKPAPAGSNAGKYGFIFE
jgi:pilus assembly protein CpaC